MDGHGDLRRSQGVESSVALGALARSILSVLSTGWHRVKRLGAKATPALIQRQEELRGVNIRARLRQADLGAFANRVSQHLAYRVGALSLIGLSVVVLFTVTLGHRRAAVESTDSETMPVESDGTLHEADIIEEGYVDERGELGPAQRNEPDDAPTSAEHAQSVARHAMTLALVGISGDSLVAIREAPTSISRQGSEVEWTYGNPTRMRDPMIQNGFSQYYLIQHGFDLSFYGLINGIVVNSVVSYYIRDEGTANELYRAMVAEVEALGASPVSGVAGGAYRYNRLDYEPVVRYDGNVSGEHWIVALAVRTVGPASRAADDAANERPTSEDGTTTRPNGTVWAVESPEGYVNLRSLPTRTANVIDRVPDKTTVIVRHCNERDRSGRLWCRVSYLNRDGWVAESYLSHTSQ